MNQRFAKLAGVLLLSWAGWVAAASAAVATEGLLPDDVYAQALLIEQETESIRRHLNLARPAPYRPVQTPLQPRHVWQKTYAVQMKISAFRRQHGLLVVAPVSREPVAAISMGHNWGQALRILTEIRILKHYLGIAGEQGPAPHVEGKTVKDVYNKFSEIHALWGGLIGGGFSPAQVYGEVMRLDKDIDGVLYQLKIFDSAYPPPKSPEAGAKEALDAGFEVLEEIQRLQRSAGLETVDFSAFRQDSGVLPSDVFNLVDMALAELELIRVRIGLLHSITPPADYYEDKHPADVAQTLGYLVNKLRLVKSLRLD
jgi:hypothetical protein